MTQEKLPNVRVVRLRTGGVMCQVETCTKDAEYLVKQRSERIHAVCKAHLQALGISDEIPTE